MVLPMALAVWRSSSGPQWAGDMAALRDQGLASVGFGGTVSAMVTQALGLLPLGNQAFRAATGSALAAAVGSLLLWRVGRRLLSAGDLPPWLASTLAAVAATMASLSPTWQREATLGGGGLVAAVIVLAGMDLVFRLSAPETLTLTPAATRGWLLLASLLGLALAESLPAGLALIALVVATVASTGKGPPLRLFGPLAALVAAVALLGCAPLLLRPLSPHSWADLGRALSAASLEALEGGVSPRTTILAWMGEVGVVSLFLATGGAVTGVLREGRRSWMTPLAVVVILDLIYPHSAAMRVGPEPLATLRVLSLSALALLAALGVAELVSFLRRLQVPMARTAALLTVVFHVTVVAVTCEEAAYAADRSAHHAAEEWTDQALGTLPTNAAVLVHSTELTWRLWAAQHLAGQRPDVLVIPAPMLRRGLLTANLLPSEPHVVDVLRDFALVGQAGEFGLSALADARPLMVELDPRWDDRVISHLAVDGAWLRYAPQVLGKSDRAMAPHVLAVEGRIAQGIHAGKVDDEPTARVVVTTLREHVAALALVGMGGQTQELLDGVDRLVPSDPFATSARLRLAHAERTSHMRSVELRDLLRF